MSSKFCSSLVRQIFAISRTQSQRHLVSVDFSTHAALRVQRSFPQRQISVKVNEEEFSGKDLSDKKAEFDEVKELISPENPEKGSVFPNVDVLSQVASKRKLSVHYQLVGELSQDFEKTFVTHCQVGDYITEGEGPSKAVSKQIAAGLMLKLLEALPQYAASRSENKPTSEMPPWMKDADQNYDVIINPLFVLEKLQKARQKKEPVYTLVSERQIGQTWEFVTQVEIDDQVCKEVGGTKKESKRHAAQAMLKSLGVFDTSPTLIQQVVHALSPSKLVVNGQAVDVRKIHVTGDLSDDLPELLLELLLKVVKDTEGQTSEDQIDFTAITSIDFSKPSEVALRELACSSGFGVSFELLPKWSISKLGEHWCKISILLTPGLQFVFHGGSSVAEGAIKAVALQALKFLQQIGRYRNRVDSNAEASLKKR